MFSTSIRSVLSASIVVAALALTVPAQVQAAPNNGHGIVYHPSDCGRGYVRSYGAGGRWSGSACGRWLSQVGFYRVWDAMDRNHNYTAYDLQRLCIAVVPYDNAGCSDWDKGLFTGGGSGSPK